MTSNKQQSSVIMIATGDDDTAILLQDTLTHQADTFLRATDHASCLDACRSQQVNLVILDVLLPPTDGFDTCREFVDVADIPVFMLIPNTVEDVRQALDAGSSDCIMKPVISEILQKRVESLLQQQEWRARLEEAEQSLHDSHEEVQSIYAAMSDLVMVFDDQGRCLKIAATNMRVLYLPLESQLGHTLHEVFPEEQADHFLKHIQQAIRENEIIHLEYDLDIDQQKYWFHTVTSPIPGRKQVVWFARDITENKKAQEAEREQRNLSKTLGEAVATMGNTLHLDEVLDRILDFVPRIVPSDHANIMLIEDEYAITRRRRGYTAEHAQPEDLPEVHLRVANTPSLQWMVTNKQPFLIANLGTYRDQWVDTPNTRAINSFLSAPILHNEQAIGFINLHSHIANRFTEEDNHRLQTFVNQTALAIKNAQLFEEVQDHARQLETRVADRTVELSEINHNLKEEIQKRQQAEDTLQRAYDELEHRVLGRTMELSLINDNLKQEIRERKRVETALIKQRTELEILHQASLELNASLDLPSVIRVVLKFALQLVPAMDVHIFLYQDGKIEFGCALWGDEYRTEAFSEPREEGMTYRVARSGKAIIVPDMTTHDLFQDAPWQGAIAGFPLRRGVQILGVINIAFDTPHEFDDAEIKVLELLADQAAIAVDNAQLVAELDQRVQERTSELESERAQLRAILEAMWAGLVYRDHAEQPLYVNPAMLKLTGYTEDEWLSREIEPLYTGLSEDAMDDLIHQVDASVEQHGYWHGEMNIIRKDGSAFDADIIRTEVRANDGQRVGMVTIVRDISQDKQLTEQKSRFIANASHELRTPVTNLKTRLYLMRRNPEKLQEHLAVAESVVEWMKTLVDDLFDYSRFEYGKIDLKRHLLDVQEIIQTAVQTQQPDAEKKEITLTVDIPNSDLTILGDRSRLLQVIVNLLSNAVRYTPEGGNITVILTLEDADVPQSQQVHIEVRDTGIGIAKDLLPQVFQPFFQADENNQGAGLGLSISKEIITQHGGELSVNSESGAGTCFTIRLALAEEAADQGA